MSSVGNNPYTLSVSLLKAFRVVIHTADGVCYRVPISPNATRVQLLAYLAWQRDKVRTKKILKEIFRQDTANKETAQSAFHAHVRLVKRDIQAAITRLNTERGADLLPTNQALFVYRKQSWWRLSSLWQVTDLEKVEAYAQIVQEAEHRVFLGPLPEQMRKACDALIAAYPGDFLEENLRAYPQEFRPLATSWVRQPYISYRESYLQALWCVAEDEWQKGQAQADRPAWEHFERAAELFREYAMYACNALLDTDVYFQTKKYQDEIHVFMSGEALYRSLIIYKAQGKRQDFEACKQAYIQQMEQVSLGRWKPREKLQNIMQWVN